MLYQETLRVRESIIYHLSGRAVDSSWMLCGMELSAPLTSVLLQLKRGGVAKGEGDTCRHGVLAESKHKLPNGSDNTFCALHKIVY